MLTQLLIVTGKWLVLWAIVLALAVPSPAAGGSAGGLAPENTIDLQLVADGLDRPVGLATPPGDRERLFLVEKPGRIRIVHNGTLLPTPFLDISSFVRSSGNEQGLLGLAFHPRYADNGYFYVYYTDLSGDTVVARYNTSADSNLADPDSALVILTQDQPYSNHNGGQLQFGPDGYLYIGLGDGGSGGDPQNRAQNPGTLLGKLLRIDVDGGIPYAVPADNPFVGPDSPLDEIWALGLRNPWRFSFDRLTGDLWIGDVGQNAWEEVDREPAGGPGGINWGWRCLEGTHVYNWSTACEELELTPPVHEYPHTQGRCSITGGYVYRGSVNSSYFGQYFFADYCVSNQVWSLHLQDSTWTATQHTLQPPSGRTLNNPTSFGQDAIGDLYILDDSQYAGDGYAGEVYRLRLRPITCVAGNYDVNGDGVVNVVDVQLVAADWQRPDYIPDYDVNCSGGVDIHDIQALAASWQA